MPNPALVVLYQQVVLHAPKAADLGLKVYALLDQQVAEYARREGKSKSEVWGIIADKAASRGDRAAEHVARKARNQYRRLSPKVARDMRRRARKAKKRISKAVR